MMGGYMAYSLLMLELGARHNAFQIAGTASWHQIPFLVAVADFALIGEELYAAGAYLSKDPAKVGSLVGQDYCKFVGLAFILLGLVLSAANVTALLDFFTL
jgi:hypothetical protein